MPFDALVTIGNFPLPEPSEYTGETATIVDSARNLNGVMIGSVIRDDISKVECSWKFLTVEQWANINKLFIKSAGGNFINSVTYFDQTFGEFRTKDMYVNDRTSGLWRRNPTSGEIMGWVDCKLNLIEV